MLTAQVWAAAATEHGLMVGAPPPSSGADLIVHGPGMPPTQFSVKVYSEPVRPSLLRRLAQQDRDMAVGLLLIVTRATPEVLSEAARTKVSVLAPWGEHSVQGVLIDATGHAHTLDPPPAPPPPAPRRPGKVAWGTYSVAFELLEAPAATHGALAARSGVSRTRVIQVLDDLGDKVTRGPRGWAPADRLTLATWLAGEYPSDAALATTWAVLDPPVTAATYVARHLEIVGVDHALTGDVAADLWAPWSRPATAWVWSATPVDLSELGATPAPAPAATLTLAVSRDPHLLRSARERDGLRTLAPWRVWVHLTQHGNTPAAQALAKALLT